MRYTNSLLVLHLCKYIVYIIIYIEDTTQQAKWLSFKALCKSLPVAFASITESCSEVVARLLSVLSSSW